MLTATLQYCVKISTHHAMLSAEHIEKEFEKEHGTPLSDSHHASHLDCTIADKIPFHKCSLLELSRF